MKIATAVGISRDCFPVDSRLVLPFEQPMAVSIAIATDLSSLNYIHHIFTISYELFKCLVHLSLPVSNNLSHTNSILILLTW